MELFAKKNLATLPSPFHERDDHVLVTIYSLRLNCLFHDFTHIQGILVNASNINSLLILLPLLSNIVLLLLYQHPDAPLHQPPSSPCWCRPAAPWSSASYSASSQSQPPPEFLLLTPRPIRCWSCRLCPCPLCCCCLSQRGAFSWPWVSPAPPWGDCWHCQRLSQPDSFYHIL
jgi:hypothetical protein